MNAMQKHIVSLIFFLFIALGVLSGQSLSSFTYKFLETTDPTTTSNVQFYANSPAGATGFSWSFGQGGSTSTDENPTYSYDITVDQEFSVALSYTINAESVDTTVTINANPAFFYVFDDSQLENIATLKKVFRSAFMIEKNETGLLGNMRFKWTFTGFEPANYSFTENTDGDYPNVYHTFEDGGDYTVGLEVYHIASPANSAVYSEVITLDTQFGADLIDFDNVPNVFSPNGDGVNDFYEVVSSGTSKLSFKVFSRSGAVVYEKEANIIKWDGKNYYGQDLSDGIYYYILEDISEVKQYNTAKGFFYIYR